ncbi:hypothetical protein ABW20_dc0104571 [Dactylellina cionopaga]|nr:hypothetical protein ABW20_dc0104571 [Dactylellina cionopaga]
MWDEDPASLLYGIPTLDYDGANYMSWRSEGNQELDAAPEIDMRLAIACAIDFLVNTVDERLRDPLVTKSPREIMDYLHQRFRPFSESAIYILENRLQNMEATRHKTSYETVINFFQSLDELERERALLDGKCFENRKLLHASFVALRATGDEVIIQYTRSWRTFATIKGQEAYSYQKYRTHLTDLLLTEMIEDESLKARGPPAIARATVSDHKKGKRNRRF